MIVSSSPLDGRLAKFDADQVLIPEARDTRERRYRRRGGSADHCRSRRGGADPVPAVVAPWPGGRGKQGRGSILEAGRWPAPAPPVISAPCSASPCRAEPATRPRSDRHRHSSRRRLPPSSRERGELTRCSTSGSGIGYSSKNIAPGPQYMVSIPRAALNKPDDASSAPVFSWINDACGGGQLTCWSSPAVTSSRSISGRRWFAPGSVSGWWTTRWRAARVPAPWDRVAYANFHQLLGIELHGVVYSAPFIEPMQSSYSSFDGRGAISGSLSYADELRLANAINAHHG